ncbi:MAG: glycosyltransferase family protein [bacterium]
MKTAIIQARVGSCRLPRKVLKEINGKPILEHAVGRVKLSKNLDKIVLAIPDNSQNDILADLAKKLNIICVRGSEKNVLSRYLKAAKKVKADIIIRITADCPLIAPEIIDEMLNIFEKEKYDYLLNDAKRKGHPRGFDVDIFFTRCLKKTASLTNKNYNKEHITTFMLEHPEIFKIKYYVAPKKLYRPDYRLCIDEELDFVLIKKIFDYFKPRENFTAEEIIKYLDKNPKIASINKNVKQKT